MKLINTKNKDTEIEPSVYNSSSFLRVEFSNNEFNMIINKLRHLVEEVSTGNKAEPLTYSWFKETIDFITELQRIQNEALGYQKVDLNKL